MRLIKHSMPVLIVAGIIALCVIEQTRQMILPPMMHRYLNYMTIAIMIVLFIVSYGFNKFKPFYIGWHIIFILLIHQEFGLLSHFEAIEWFYVLLPINLLILFFIRNGTVLSTRGKLIGIMILGQAIFLYAMEDPPRIGSASEFLEKWLPVVQEPFTSLSYILFIAVILVLVVSVTIQYSIDKIAIVGSILSIFLGLYHMSSPFGTELLLFGAGLLLILSVIFGTYSLAYIDELTQIPSRRKLMADGMKLGRMYSIAMIDIDFFKKFNDRYGHDVGDKVLKMVAGCLKQVKGGGKAYRYGGEEFTIIFPKRKIEDVLTHLENLRESVSKKRYIHKRKTKDGQWRQQNLKVTISIGVAEKNAAHKTIDEVTKAADQALYRAKKKGRNRVSR